MDEDERWPHGFASQGPNDVKFHVQPVLRNRFLLDGAGRQIQRDGGLCVYEHLTGLGGSESFDGLAAAGVQCSEELADAAIDLGIL